MKVCKHILSLKKWHITVVAFEKVHFQLISYYLFYEVLPCFLKTFLLGCDIDKVSFCNFHFLWFFVNVNSLSFTFLVFSLSGQEKALKALSVAMPSFSLVAKYKFVFISVQGQQFFRPLFLKLYLHSLIKVLTSYNSLKIISYLY